MAWRIGGRYAAACSCEIVCPCAVDGKPTDPQRRGECRGSLVFAATEGNFDDVDLSGVTFALYNYFPSNLTAGNWRLGVVVDEAANDQQVQAIERIVSGQAGGAFGDFAQFVEEFIGVQRGSVSLSDGDRPTARVGDLSEYSIEAHRGMDGNPTTIKNAMFGFAPEFKIGKASGSANIFGETFEPIYGEYADFEFTSGGAEAVRGRG